MISIFDGNLAEVDVLKARGVVPRMGDIHDTAHRLSLRWFVRSGGCGWSATVMVSRRWSRGEDAPCMPRLGRDGSVGQALPGLADDLQHR